MSNKRKLTYLLTMLLAVGVISCNKKDTAADAYGNFEATEITVSAESTGKIDFLNLVEGMELEKNVTIGQIDTVQLYLNKQQLLASKNMVHSKSNNVLSQRNIFQAQLRTAQLEQNRILAMYNENAATQRQVDEVNGNVTVLEQQMKSVLTQNAPISSEVKSIDVQIEKINDQLKKSKIINPIAGIVLAQYAEPNEITTFGKPLYKIADLSVMILRVYFSETQLPNIKIGQEVTVSIDDKAGTKPYQGTVSWISSSAEFTPKIIQTKEERVNLVYAVKVLVKNDGRLKIGMPAEVKL